VGRPSNQPGWICALVNQRHITPPSLALGLSLQGGGGKGFVVVTLGDHAPVRADASPLLDMQDAAEKIGLDVEPVEAALVARRIDPAKIHGGHGSNLAIVQQKSTD
jgi:hypothetical protein